MFFVKIWKKFGDVVISKLNILIQQDYASTAGIEVFSPVSHTLFNPAEVIQKVCDKLFDNWFTPAKSRRRIIPRFA